MQKAGDQEDEDPPAREPARCQVPTKLENLRNTQNNVTDIVHAGTPAPPTQKEKPPDLGKEGDQT